jgi:hypothetical protein
VTRPVILLALALAALSVGCGHAFEMAAPQNFVVLDEDDEQYAQRATSADGVVISVREIDNDNEGSLQFWTEAIRNRLRIVGGYALVSEAEVRAGSGERGKQMRFGRDEGSRPYFYWVTLFVTDDHVFVIEAGGRRETFERLQPQIERAIARFQVD